MTYAQCVRAVQLGELPDGTPLQPALRAHRGRALIISTTCAASATEIVQLCTSLKLLTTALMSPIGMPAACHYLTAASARLVASSQEPFELTPVEVEQLLTEPGLVEMLNAMARREATENFTHEDMVNVLTARAPDECVVSHPWLHDAPSRRVRLCDDVMPTTSFEACLRASMETYIDGPAQLHVQLVQSGAQYFVCAWQLSLAFMGELRNVARAGAAAHAAVRPVGDATTTPVPAAAAEGTAHARAMALMRDAAVHHL